MVIFLIDFYKCELECGNIAQFRVAHNLIIHIILSKMGTIPSHLHFEFFSERKMPTWPILQWQSHLHWFLPICNNASNHRDHVQSSHNHRGQMTSNKGGGVTSAVTWTFLYPIIYKRRKYPWYAYPILSQSTRCTVGVSYKIQIKIFTYHVSSWPSQHWQHSKLFTISPQPCELALCVV